ncbi:MULTISPECIES: glycosyltransferase [unclassified Serratia (in: enterobacteria)]|uniref:glycosyltransferase family 2 protein n=1 Tax=unclassified Serratia (in: enterobacteria) TaxID=2647522 RepID=UPI000505EEC5|nr:MULTISPECIES: glycosyltransferase [unclassified Serratia (in: enterobacteria)]KFK97884.1 hypothetical protein JV45_00895 [Serratia sp. Ag2]KFL00275.1 hypothetical protein IV04_02205 [Serratia sp. Ag1]
MFKLTEAQIMSNWSIEEPIGVSICCITYKQEKYIKQAIDSFLMQKTTFPFEIIIGEDHGKDNTLTILNEYQQKYPRLIRVITSDDNIGANSNLLRVFHAAEGKYIAVCEGDDYWCNENKIQVQFDKLEADSSISICVHSAKLLKDNNLHNGFKMSIKESFFDVNDVINCNKQYSPTASYFFKRSNIGVLPNWFSEAPIGDFFIEVYMLSQGKGCFLSAEMAVYRVGSDNSWSSSINENIQKYIQTQERIVNYTNKIVTDFPNQEIEINDRVMNIYLSIMKRCILCGVDDIVYTYRSKYHSLKKHIILKNEIVLFLFNFPKMLRFLHRFKKPFNKNFW